MYVEALFTIRPAQPVFFIAETPNDEGPPEFRMDVDELFIDVPDEGSDSDEKEDRD